jgi:hypothetical protein
MLLKHVYVHLIHMKCGRAIVCLNAHHDMCAIQILVNVTNLIDLHPHLHPLNGVSQRKMRSLTQKIQRSVDV